MFEKLIKEKTKKKYILIFSLSFIIVVYNGYQKYSLNKIIDYSNLKTQIHTLKTQNTKLENNIKVKKEIFKLISQNLINKSELKKEIDLFCNGIIRDKLVSEAKVIQIDVPYKFLNVARVTFSAGNAVDVLILKRLLLKIYNIKSVQKNGTNLIVEIYKDV